MTFDRFKELWDECAPEKIESPAIVMEGSSERTIDALCREAAGDHSVFDEVAKRLSE